MSTISDSSLLIRSTTFDCDRKRVLPISGGAKGAVVVLVDSDQRQHKTLYYIVGTFVSAHFSKIRAEKKGKTGCKFKLT